MVTLAANVPLNDALAAGQVTRSGFEGVWDTWNVVRAVAATGSLVPDSFPRLGGSSVWAIYAACSDGLNLPSSPPERSPSPVAPGDQPSDGFCP
ncbi:hypothetical protein GCM10009734_60080 [Nonomuraea bangladeshensis]